jgi:hypothetical protein
MSMPPAGWYADERSQAHERWWNGDAWTEHLRSRETLIPSALPADNWNTASHTSRIQRETAVKKNNSMAYTGLVLALIGLIINPFAIPSILGTVFAAIGLARANELSAQRVSNHGTGIAVTGIVLGLVGLVFFAVNLATF